MARLARHTPAFLGIALGVMIAAVPFRPDDDHPPLDHRPAWRVESVLHLQDGDTFCGDLLYSSTFKAGRHYRHLKTEDIRINGYDSPDRGQPGYTEARDDLRELFDSGNVWVKWTGKWTLGRLACDVYVQRPDGEVVGVAVEMIKRGHDSPRAGRK